MKRKRKRIHIYPNSLFVDLYIVQHGHEQCDFSHSFGPILTHNYLFHYIVSGKGRFFQPDNSDGTELTSGQGFLMPPDTICSYSADSDDPWEYYWVEFNGIQAKQSMKLAGFTDTQLIYTPRTDNKIEEIAHIFADTLETNVNNEYLLLGNLYQLLDALIQNSSQQISDTRNEISNVYIRRAIDYIRDNYQNDISVADIANHCNLNRNYFTRLFKAELNLTPSQFLIKYRLNKAADLLMNTDLSIQCISEEIGYSNQFNFSATFKKHYNFSPFDWRNKHS
ncbi:AraC family transcriptional regulator [Fundicoccus sp. Sow4_D5]|uniref:AraC family transcriptional regulator n=1 Tax=Fundicoccus sp. Sow4_D5 TaxID=3438782 RepID=UPI003F91B597